MERPWLILCRVVRVAAPGAHGHADAEGDAAVEEAEEQVAAVEAAAEAQDGDAAAVGEAEEDPQAQLEESVLNANTDAAASAAAHAARGAAEPDLIISVSAPPLVSSLVAGPGSHPDAGRPDRYPYVIATGRFCLLAHFAVHPSYGTNFNDNPTQSTLVVVRHFRRADGQIAACAVRVPACPPNILALTNVESVGLVCNVHTGDFTIAELEINRSCLPSFIRFSSDIGVWQSSVLTNPLDEDDHLRRWEPHGTVAINSTVVWFDLSWGIICCNLNQQPPDLRFYRVPRGRKLRDGSVPDLHYSRCITVSENLVRYVEIIRHPHQAATVSMWCRDVENNARGWIKNYKVSFQHIWEDNSYDQTGLPWNPPLLVGVSPVNSNVVYFTLAQRLFGVNVPEYRVVHCEGYAPLNRPPGLEDEPNTSRFLITWNLDADGAINVGHQPDNPSDHGDSSDDGSMDEGEIESLSPQDSDQDSSSSNNGTLGTMEEGELDYQSPLE